MAPLTEFTLFRELPLELRLIIWHLAPQSESARVIGLVPPSELWYARVPGRGFAQQQSLQEGNRQDGNSRPSSHFRYAVQPRERAAVFPPLHVNREARGVWLSRLSRVGRHARLPAVENSGIFFDIQFDTPFVDYGRDTFVLYDGWKPGLLFGEDFARGLDYDWSFIDPFLGLDHERIQNAAICEVPSGVELAVGALDIHRLPALRTLSIIALGPDVFHQEFPLNRMAYNSFIHWREMPAVDVQNLDCYVRDLGPRMVEIHPFFNQARPRHAIKTSPRIRPLPRYTVFVKAWLWHGQKTSLHAYDALAPAAWWEFTGYLFEGPDDADCPLPFQGCGVDGHRRQEMIQWTTGFDIDHKILYAAEFGALLRNYSIFDSDGGFDGPLPHSSAIL